MMFYQKSKSWSRTRACLTMAVVGSLLVTAACGRSSSKTTATSETSGSGSSSAPGSASSGNAKQSYVIGWSQRGISGSDWWKTLIAGGQNEAAKLGVKLDVLDANRDTTQQNQDVQTLITKGVDAVIMNPQDPLGVAPAVHALQNAKIPLVVVNSNLDPSLVPDAFCYVAEDQVATGEMVGKAIAQDAIKKFGTGAGTWKLVGIGGYPGDVISELRYKGFMQGYNSVMSSYPQIKTVELPFRYGHWLPDQALSPIRDVATANPDLKIVYSESDVMQAGIEQALKGAGIWNKILEGSYDGGMNSIKEMVDDPNGPLQADGSNQPWDQGVLAVKMAVAAIHGDRSACPGGTYYIKTTLVTPDNARQYYDPSQTYVRANTYG